MQERRERNPELSTEEELRTGRQIVELYRAWHVVEQDQPDGHKIDGVDFDIVNDDYEKIQVSSRQETIGRFETMAQGITPSTPALEFFQDKLISSATFLRVLEGEQFS